MTPWENVDLLRRIRARAAKGAPAAAEAMAKHVADRTANVTLRRTAHAPGQYWKAAPGAPPASASGALAAGMYATRAKGGRMPTAYAGNSALHAQLLEFGGCKLEPSGAGMMTWHDSGGWWSHHKLPLGDDSFPEHPFLRPTVREAIEDGSLLQAAIDAFRKYDP